jgi:glutamate formiminotransferase / formiminotetrahydrofolate cyclodeaminase
MEWIMKGFFECVPNFSEGRDKARVDEIVKAIRAVPGALVLDVEMDGDHNRCVLTFVGTAEACSEAAFQAAKRAAQLIDLNSHRGAHPRMGATDVVPFVPLEGATMEDAVELARQVGKRIGDELGIPVFLYEEAATRTERHNLPAVRKGEFEGLRELIGQDPERDPDFGPRAIHPTAGATAVGARPFLIAFNLNLKTEDVSIAKAIAKEIREKDGGLPGIRAMGFMLDELKMAQVSVNVVDYRKTSLATLTQVVTEKAALKGVEVHESELIGLAPADALITSGAQYLRVRGFGPDMLLENRVAKARAEAGTHASAQPFLDSVAGPDPTPGGGSVSAFAGAQAAALTRMVAGLTVGKKKYADVEDRVKELASLAQGAQGRFMALVAEDAKSYDAVSAAYKLPKDTEEQKAQRSAAIEAALLAAARVPLETASLALSTLGGAEEMARIGNGNCVTDAGVAGFLAHAACLGALANVRVNLVGRGGGESDALRSEASGIETAAARLRADLDATLLKGLAG